MVNDPINSFRPKIQIDVGEIGVHLDGVVYILRPSWRAMKRLGDSKEIIRVCASVLNQEPAYFEDALAVLYACSDHDVSHIFGSYGPAGYEPALATMNDVVQLARCLLKHGVVGDLKLLADRSSLMSQLSFTQVGMAEFVVDDRVSQAMGELDISADEALDLSTSAYMKALFAKYGQSQNTGNFENMGKYHA